MTSKIDQMQKTIDGLSVVKTLVIVVGGLSSLGSLEGVETWIKAKLIEIGAPPVLNIWIYGKFTEIVLVCFGNISEANAAIEKVTRAQIELSRKRLWAREDATPETQACETFLFGVRKMLITWGGREWGLRVEVAGPTKFLKVGGKVAVTASVVDGELHCEWADDWKVWEELHASQEMTDLFGKVIKKLSGGGKGKGKDKNK